MHKIFSFVGPILSGVVSPALRKLDSGVNNVADLADKNPKQSGLYAVLLSWLGIDPGVIGDLGGWIVQVGTFLQGFGV